MILALCVYSVWNLQDWSDGKAHLLASLHPPKRLNMTFWSSCSHMRVQLVRSLTVKR